MPNEMEPLVAGTDPNGPIRPHRCRNCGVNVNGPFTLNYVLGWYLAIHYVYVHGRPYLDPRW